MKLNGITKKNICNKIVDEDVRSNLIFENLFSNSWYSIFTKQEIIEIKKKNILIKLTLNKCYYYFGKANKYYSYLKNNDFS